LILFAVPAGLAAGALGWFAAGGASATITKLEPVRTAVVAIQRPRSMAFNAPPAEITELAGMPLLLLTTGPGAVPDPAVRLDGVARSKGRQAALLSIDDKPAEWMSIGESRDNVGLQQVLGGRVIVDTPFGTKEVALGQRVGPVPFSPGANGPALSDARPAPVMADKIPPGFRPPMPPASAPRPR